MKLKKHSKFALLSSSDPLHETAGAVGFRVTGDPVGTVGKAVGICFVANKFNKWIMIIVIIFIKTIIITAY